MYIEKFHKEEKVELITREMLINDPLRALILIKTNIKLMPTSGRDELLARRNYIRIVEKYDDGFVADRRCRGVIKDIIKELSYSKHRNQPVLSYIFESVDDAIRYAKGLI